MAYTRFRDEIVAQTGELAALLEDRGEPDDALVAVASCPGWNVHRPRTRARRELAGRSHGRSHHVASVE